MTETAVKKTLADIRPVVPPPGDAPHLVTHEAKDLLSRELTAPRYACAGLLVEGLSILAGRPKIGKSWLDLQLALAKVEGAPFLDRATVRGEALVLALEDPERRLQSRLRILLAGRACPAGLHYATELPRVGQGGIEYLTGFLDAHPAVDLVVLDTIVKVRKATPKNGNQYQEDSDFGGALQKLARERGISLLGVHHTRKEPSEDFLDSVSGTLGLAGAADSILVLERRRGSAEATLKVTGRDIEELELAVGFSRETCSWSFLGPAAEIAMSHERREVLETLRAAPLSLTPAAIGKEIGKKSGAVRRLLQGMAKDGLVEPGLKYGTWTPLRYE